MSDLRNSLADLAEQIRESAETIAAAERTSVEHALRAGFLLCQAKNDCEHGEWLPFLTRANVNERTAQRWMQIARAGLKSDMVSDLGSVRAALDYIAKLELPEPGDILFVSPEGDQGKDSGPACAWIGHSEGNPGFFDITAIRTDGQVLQTNMPPKGETVCTEDGFFNGVWLCLDMMVDIPHEEREFTMMPAEMLERDTFDFLGKLDEPFDPEKTSIAQVQLPKSYEHAVAKLRDCIADYSLDRAKAAWRALRALNAKMQAWPNSPKMIPVYARIAESKEISQLEDRVRALVRAHNPELFTKGSST